jgi:hypothetical protein
MHYLRLVSSTCLLRAVVCTRGLVILFLISVGTLCVHEALALGEGFYGARGIASGAMSPGAPLSSSAAAIDTVGAGADGAPVKVDIQRECELVPHSGYIIVEHLVAENATMVKHRRTLEGRQLPGSTWTVVYDEQGFGCLVAEDDDRVLLLEQWLNRQLYRSPNGEEVVLHKKPGEPERTWSLSATRQEYEDGLLTFPVMGVAGTGVSIQVYRLCWPRQALRHMLDMTSIYKLTDGKTYCGFPSKWAFYKFPFWKKMMTAAGIDGDSHVMWSADDHGNGDDSRFLPKVAGTASAYLAVLAKGSTGEPHVKEGHLVRGDPTGCDHLLLAICAYVCAGRPCSLRINIVADKSWSCVWPGADVCGQSDYQLTVTDSGMIDFGSWRACVESGDLPDGHAIKTWWRTLSKKVDDHNQLLLKRALAVAADSKVLKGFFGQLLWAVGMEWEKVLFLMAKTKDQAKELPPRCLMRFELQTPLAMMTSVTSLEKYLARHVKTSIKVSKGHRHVSIASDKAAVRGLNLTNSIMVLENGTAIVMPPQAPAVHVA